MLKEEGRMSTNLIRECNTGVEHVGVEDLTDALVFVSSPFSNIAGILSKGTSKRVSSHQGDNLFCLIYFRS